MKRLILMRHAKSDWSASAGDHARPLNPRGRHAAALMGDWLRTQDLLPDEVILSDAMRTRETLLRLDLPEDTPVSARRTLYLADDEAWLDAVQGASGDSLLLIGHNPGIGFCAERIVAQPPEHPDFGRYPTCATLVAEFEIDSWEQADWGGAMVLHFTQPRDLE
ncbi:MAG: histidine phosphatase family protein [Sulfitobacter sp.]|nr:histidine phosphatase family protein [Sulfitobacter sp.]